MPIINDIRTLCIPRGSRVLGIDYGDKRVGIAVSDTTLSIASPFVILESHDVFEKLFKIIDEYCISLVVIGNPISLSGQDSGKQLKKVMKFTEKLLSIRDMNVYMWDERLSTHAAMRYILQAGLSRGKQKRIKDKVAASFILQGALDSCR